MHNTNAPATMPTIAKLDSLFFAPALISFPSLLLDWAAASAAIAAEPERVFPSVTKVTSEEMTDVGLMAATSGLALISNR